MAPFDLDMLCCAGAGAGAGVFCKSKRLVLESAPWVFLRESLWQMKAGRLRAFRKCMYVRYWLRW